MYLGDRPLTTTFYFYFTTRRFSTGAPHTLAGTPSLSAYEDNSDTQITAGLTLAADADSRTGLNRVTVAPTGANGYETGKSYTIIIEAGTVDSVSVVGEVVGYFTIECGPAYLRLGAPAGASVSADIAAIEAQTDDIGAAGAGLTAIPWNAAWDAEVESEVDDALGGGTGTALTAIPWNAAWDAEVQSEVDDALVAQRLDELLNADSDIDGAAPPTVGSVFHELMTKTTGSFTYDQTTDSLEATADALVVIDGIVDTILVDTNELQADWADGGRLDLILDARSSQTSVNTIDDFLDTEIAAILAAVDTEVAAILALLDDARTEPGQGAPPVNPDLATKIDYLYKSWRNKKDNDGSVTNLYADDGSTIDHKQTTSEAAGTVTKAEWITGA